MFYPTWVDIGVFLGTIGIFFAFYLAFARYFPVLAISELKTILKISGESYKDGTAPGHDDHGGGDSHHETAPLVEEKPVVEEVAPAIEEKIAEVAPAIEEKVEEKKAEVKEVISDEEKSKRVSSLMDKLGAADASNADDLKVISGVGPKMESTLNEIGIYSYEQVSKMTDNEYDLLDSITGSFPGRAKRDDWAKQAKELMNK